MKLKILTNQSCPINSQINHQKKNNQQQNKVKFNQIALNMISHLGNEFNDSIFGKNKTMIKNFFKLKTSLLNYSITKYMKSHCVNMISDASFY